MGKLCAPCIFLKVKEKNSVVQFLPFLIMPESWSILSKIPVDATTRVLRLIEARSFEVQNYVHEQFLSAWEAMVGVVILFSTVNQFYSSQYELHQRSKSPLSPDQKPHIIQTKMQTWPNIYRSVWTIPKEVSRYIKPLPTNRCPLTKQSLCFKHSKSWTKPPNNSGRL